MEEEYAEVPGSQNTVDQEVNNENKVMKTGIMSKKVRTTQLMMQCRQQGREEYGVSMLKESTGP